MLELFPAPNIGYRWFLIGIAAINAMVSIILEDIFTEIGLQKFWKRYKLKDKSTN